LFSGGKDSSASLILTRDAVKEYSQQTGAEVYIVYIYITGNTHPLNTFCASSIALWHQKHYGFKPVFLAHNNLFQEYAAKYGLQIGKGRWCYSLFKDKPLKEFEKNIQSPVIEIDGMKQNDSKYRSKVVSSEIQEITRQNGFKFYAWHPIYNLKKEESLDLVKAHEEFSCVLNLYESFGDSLNCIMCPYKNREKVLRYHKSDGNALYTLYAFAKEAFRSEKWLKRFAPPEETGKS